VSEEIIGEIDKNLLVVSDEINMLGLRGSYFRKKNMYRDLINSGENIILDFSLNSFSAYGLISEIEKDVQKGIVDEKKINESVKKILIKKGYKIR
jgi:beta-glucosidase-like glycosyl hydrolase